MGSSFEFLAQPPFPCPDPDLERVEAAEKKLFEAALSEPCGSCPLRQFARIVCVGLDEHQELTSHSRELFERVEEEDAFMPGMCHFAKLLTYAHPNNKHQVIWLLRKDVAENDCHAARWFLATLWTNEVVDDKVRTRLYEDAWEKGGIGVAGLQYANMVFMEGGEDNVRKSLAIYETVIAKKECSYAMNRVADVYLTGAPGVERSMERAKALYERAFRRGCVRAMRVLGGILLQINEDDADVARGVELLEKAIDEGDEEALLLSAQLYRGGNDVVQRDMGKAIELYEKGIERGCLRCAIELGKLLYRGGEDVDIDLARALELFNLTEKDETLFRKVRFDVAVLISGGWDGVDEDMQRAVKIYEQILAEEGNQTPAMFNLAGILVRGEGGVEQDAARAAALYEAAILQNGHVRSMLQLGILLSGKHAGIEQDTGRAAELLEGAIEGGVREGKYFLAGLLAGFDDKPIDAKKGVQLFEEVIEELEHIGAMNELAVIVGEGWHGVTRDVERAADLCERGVIVALENNKEDLKELGIEAIPEWAVSEDSEAASIRSFHVSNGFHYTLMRNLAELLLSGMIPRNVDKAVRLCERALRCPSKEEQWRHARLFDLLRETERMMRGLDDCGGDIVSAVRICELVIGATPYNPTSRGYAQRLLAGVLIEGTDDVPCDEKRALRLYEDAVEAGDRKAMIALGDLMRSGIGGCRLDEGAAFDLYAQALQEYESGEVSREAAVKLAQVCGVRHSRKMHT